MERGLAILIAAGAYLDDLKPSVRVRLL